MDPAFWYRHEVSPNVWLTAPWGAYDTFLVTTLLIVAGLAAGLILLTGKNQGGK